MVGLATGLLASCGAGILGVAASSGSDDGGDNSAPSIAKLQMPIVQLLNDAVIANPDERRAIPVPVRVIDEEGDLVELIGMLRVCEIPRGEGGRLDIYPHAPRYDDF